MKTSQFVLCLSVLFSSQVKAEIDANVEPPAITYSAPAKQMMKLDSFAGNWKQMAVVDCVAANGKPDYESLLQDHDFSRGGDVFLEFGSKGSWTSSKLPYDRVRYPDPIENSGNTKILEQTPTSVKIDLIAEHVGRSGEGGYKAENELGRPDYVFFHEFTLRKEGRLLIARMKSSPNCPLGGEELVFKPFNAY